MKCAFVVVQGKGRSSTSLSLDACLSIHSTQQHTFEAIFFKIRNLLLEERSTEFFRFKKA
ncbi:MAG: hypothetical protein P8179_10155 [Candidatus Thiodiazotropha sp.]